MSEREADDDYTGQVVVGGDYYYYADFGGPLEPEQHHRPQPHPQHPPAQHPPAQHQPHP